MDLPPAWCQVCVCGRTFSVPQAYTFHQRSCQKTKKRLSSALDKAKEVWQSKKRRIMEVMQDTTAEGPPEQNIVVEQESNDVALAMQHEGASMNDEDLDQPLAERRGRRENRQLPKRYRDILPAPPAALPPAPQLVTVTSECAPTASPAATQASPSSEQTPNIYSRVGKLLKSTRNKFGLFRQYHATRFPDHDPNENITRDDLMDTSPGTFYPADPYHPYPNQSSFLLGEWYWSGGLKKTQSGFRDLIKIVGHPNFQPEDVSGTNWRRIDAQLGGDRSCNPSNEEDWEDEEDNGDWVKTPIKIKVPFHKRSLHPGQKEFDAGTLHHRKLMSVVRGKIMHLSSHPHLHFEPYELFWQPTETSKPVKVYGELYTSEAFIEAHRDLQESPGEPGCDLPRVVVGLMFASDGTQLNAFSTAKLWPVYLAMGNESKDRRSKPSCQAFEHVAYLETLPDAFKTFATEHLGGKGPNGAFMAHCHRELYHAQWAIILDDEFLEAYQHGIVIKCCDGFWRRFHPRIFTYSADYKEKILIASIRNLGRCPCPRCLIPLDRVANMGMRRDMAQRRALARMDDVKRRARIETAREKIYEKGYVVDSRAVEDLLQEDSLVPTANAFSSKLAAFGFNMFDMLAVDLMHEVELGVWKAVFIHLLRILDCQDGSLKHELDRRFREIPPFGVDGIRKIWSNRSELKKMTAHDYEDMLQCAIPVFDGLLPEPHNTYVLKLLFELAHWHGLAKLRMHTDATLDILSPVTTSLGNRLRTFEEKTCTAYDTRELERERAARQRRQEKSATNAASESRRPTAPNTNARKQKKLNLRTYKHHALGDYVDTIRRFGTTDSYSTQPSELEHRTSKTRSLRTSGRSIPQQISRVEQRERRISTIRERLNRPRLSSPSEIDPEDLTHDPGVQYNIGQSQKCPVHIPTFLQKNEGDPAIKNFLPKLREHLLPRIQRALLQGVESLSEPSSVRTGSDTGPFRSPDGNACNFVFFKNDCIYHHKLIRFHFTTYDVRRGTDIVNPGTSRRNVMLLADDAEGSLIPANPHHFLYARVLGGYHVNAIYTGPGMHDFESRRFDFLWVRWFEVVNPGSSGWSNSKLDSVRFPPMNENRSFGFVDPKDVLRGCHILPVFAKGKRQEDGIGISRCAKDGKDYNQYFVGRFSDRDLLMRYHWGLGVGHFHAHQPASTSSHVSDLAGDAQDFQVPDMELQEALRESLEQPNDRGSDMGYDSDNPELRLEDRDLEGWDDIEMDDVEDGDEDEDEDEDEDIGEPEDFTGML